MIPNASNPYPPEYICIPCSFQESSDLIPSPAVSKMALSKDLILISPAIESIPSFINAALLLAIPW